MKPHEITLRRVLDLMDGLPLFENVTHRRDDEHGHIISFTVLDIMVCEDRPTAQRFDLPLTNAYWYVAGVVNGTMWQHNIHVMAATRGGSDWFGST